MAERRVEWAGAARDDLRTIAWHIAQDNLANALAVAERIDRRAGALATFSDRGRIVPELRHIGGVRYREVIEEPWRIIYLVDEPIVHIAAVVDSRRDVQEWLRERMGRFKETTR